MDHFTQANGATQVYERQMQTCKSIPDLCRLYSVAVKVLTGLGENLLDADLAMLLGRLEASRDHAQARLPNLGAVPLSAAIAVISAEQFEVLEQLVMSAGMQMEEVTQEFEVTRLCLLPESDFTSARDWLVDRASGKRGAPIPEPKVKPAEAPKEKFDKQAWVDKMARRKGYSSPLLAILDMENDLP